MVDRLMWTALVFLLVLYGPMSALALSITIDDSTDTISVTSDSTATQIRTGTSDTITDANGNQFFVPTASGGRLVIEWAAITDPNLPLTGGLVGIIFLEPGTTIESDFFQTGERELLVGSDVDAQGFGDAGSYCAHPDPQLPCATEPGAFQNFASTLYPGATNLSIQFRSDITDATVPEPATGFLLTCALVGFASYKASRGFRRRERA